MATFTLLDLVHKLKEIVQELVNKNYSLLGSYGYYLADELRESIEDYPGAVAMPPTDEDFVDAVSRGYCLPNGEYPAGELSFDEFESYILEPGSKWIVDSLLWEPGDPPMSTDLVLTIDFHISEDAISPKIRELRVP